MTTNVSLERHKTVHGASAVGLPREGRVTTDSEEELLTQILISMSQTHTAAKAATVEDESDYANLWDSESGSNCTTFQTNKDVMGSLLRRKVGRQLSCDSDRRKAWIASASSRSSSSIAESVYESNSLQQFNMDKFRSLQEKAENMDLTLTDFFSDLKHSNSIMELSKMFSSAQLLSPNGKVLQVVFSNRLRHLSASIILPLGLSMSLAYLLDDSYYIEMICPHHTISRLLLPPVPKPT